MIEYVLFDLDGTLMDFHKGERKAFIETVSEFAGILPDEIYIDAFKEINENLFNRFARGEMKRIEFQEKRFEEIYFMMGIDAIPSLSNQYFLESLRYKADLYSDVLPILDYLKGKYKLYIASNGMGSVQRKRLEVSGILSYFSDIIISDDANANKPDIEFFEYAMQKIGDNDPAKYVIIGDRLETDIYGGRAAGMHTIYLNRENKWNHEEYITTLDSLKSML